MKSTNLLLALIVITLAACVPERFAPSNGHLKGINEQTSEDNIPSPVLNSSGLPAPRLHRVEETFTIVVSNVPLKEVLFALARDARMDIDIDPGITGRVTLTAINRPLTQILERVSRQADIRYKLVDGLLIVSPDSPYFKSYNIPYLNMTRNAASNVAISTQIEATGTGDSSNGSGGGGGGSDDIGNNSSTEIQNISNNQFWPTLINNIQAILRGGDSSPFKSQNSGSGNGEEESKDDISVIANPENSLLIVKASKKQHATIQRYLDRVIEQARRQVLIEATVVEVQLSDDYQGGVDWEVVADQARYRAMQSLLGPTVLATEPFLSATFTGGDFSATVKLLDEFGNVKVLSSPKLMVLNNQTAVLKVVDNRVYFTTSVESNTTQGVVTQIFETQLHTVPVGFVMSVTPQIGSNKKIILNTRPTISRIVAFVADPNPALALAGVESLIPEIQVREMESILKIASGNTGIIGGLMQDVIDESTSGIPLLDRLEYLGNLFGVRTNKYKKTELIVFIRPQIIDVASLDADLQPYNQFLDNSQDIQYPRYFKP